MPNKSISLFLLVIILLFSCHTSQEIINSSGDEQKMNVRYGEHKRNIMNVYLPAHRDHNTPFVILLHGGAWVLGSKKMLRTMQQKLLDNGIASANINYRLIGNKADYLDMLEDIDNAVKFCQLHTKEWNLTTKKYHVMGESAGAHLALLYGNKHPENIQTIISLSGMVDFGSREILDKMNPRFVLPLIEKLAGAKYDPWDSIPEAFKDMSPYYRINNVNTFILQGGRDLFANPKVTIQYVELLTEKEVPHQFDFIPKWGHSYRLFSKKNRAFVYKEVLNWLDKNNN